MLLSAFAGPLVMSFVFVAIFHAVNDNWPLTGYQEAYRDSAMVRTHGLAQLAFVIIGGVLAKPAKRRVLFLLIAIPMAGFACLLVFAGLFAG